MKRALIGAALGLLFAVIVVFVVWFIVGATLANLRDLVLVAVGLALFLFFLSLVGVGLGLVGVIGLVRERLPELLDKGSSALDRVQGTTGFVGEKVAAPIIKASAAAAGARAAVQAFVRRDGAK